VAVTVTGDTGGDQAPRGAARETFTLEEAAGRMGVHYMTLYRYVRTGRLPAHRRGRRWVVDAGDLDRMVPHPAPPGRGHDRWADRSERLRGRLLAGDERGCWGILEAALLSGSPADAYLKVLAPALRAVGDMWATGAVSVAEEHRATAVALGLAGRMGPLFTHRGVRRRGTVLLATAAGDSHILPGRMVADVLRSEGFAVVDLGADAPVASVVETAKKIPDLGAVGVTLATCHARTAVASVVAGVRDARPGVPILAGGPALVSAPDAAAVGADGWAPDARAAADVVASLKGFAPATRGNDGAIITVGNSSDRADWRGHPKEGNDRR
jgi:excisionase family DNA binding protein